MIERLPFIPRKIALKQLRAQAVSRSPFTFQAQIVAAPMGAAWAAQVEFAPMKGDRAAAMAAWLTRRDGMAVPFLFGNTAKNGPRGTARGSGYAVVGAKGSSLVAFSGTGTLLEGDYFSCNDRLYIVSEVVAPDQLRIWPALRDTGGAIAVDEPAGLFRLSSPQTEEVIDLGAVSGFSLECVEAL